MWTIIATRPMHIWHDGCITIANVIETPVRHLRTYEFIYESSITMFIFVTKNDRMSNFSVCSVKEWYDHMNVDSVL